MQNQVQHLLYRNPLLNQWYLLEQLPLFAHSCNHIFHPVEQLRPMLLLPQVNK